MKKHMKLVATVLSAVLLLVIFSCFSQNAFELTVSYVDGAYLQGQILPSLRIIQRPRRDIEDQRRHVDKRTGKWMSDGTEYIERIIKE